jgi:hypothetical protein
MIVDIQPPRNWPVPALRFKVSASARTGRRGIRNDVSRYEAVSMVLVDPAENPG